MAVLPYRGIWPRVAAGVFVAPGAVIVGDVTVEEGASVWFGAVVRGDMAPIRIGESLNVQDNCTLHTDRGIPCSIGRGCTLGHGAVVHGATIGDGVLIGMHATVLNRAEIGHGCIIAAASLVPEGTHIPSGRLVMGIPGRSVRTVTENEQERVLGGSERYRSESRVYAEMLGEHSREERK